MANLGNQKIKDTYKFLLQTDVSGNLQRLDGSSPNPTVSDEDVNGGDKWADLTVEIQGAWTALGMSQAIYDGEEEGGLDLGAWKPYSDLP
jgi:hypothetical protein